jgi:hypothetical protein
MMPLSALEQWWSGICLVAQPLWVCQPRKLSEVCFDSSFRNFGYSLCTVRDALARLEHTAGGILLLVAAVRGAIVEAVRRLTGQPGFAVPPGRWVVELTSGWLIWWRRLVRD